MTHARAEADYCPCCHQPRDLTAPVSGFGLTLASSGWLWCGDKRARVSRGTAAMLRPLILRGTASRELMMLALDGESLSRNIISVYMARLRPLLRDLGAPVTIKCVPSYGYELVPTGEVIELERKCA